MSLTRFTGNTNVIAQLPDTPSLTSEQLKEKFDEAGSSIKDYLNNDLASEVEQLVAEEKSTLQRQISNLSISTTEAINNAVTTENMIISDQYSTMKTYKIGDLCIYNNVLYKCITEISVAEAWNSEHWEQTTITDSVREKEVYSTEEKIVGTWINGKPLYQITLTGTKVYGSDLELSIPENIDNIISIEGTIKTTSGITYNLDRTEGDSYTRLEIATRTSRLTYKSSGASTYFNGDVFVTLKYTKTTDL